MDDIFTTKVTTGHESDPSIADSLDSMLNAYLNQQDRMQETITGENVLRVSGRSNSLTGSCRTGSVNSHMSVALSKCNSIFLGCNFHSSATCDLDSTTNEDFILNALHDYTEQEDPASTNEYSQNPLCLQTVIDNTNLVLKSWKLGLFVRTPAYELSLQTLRRHGVVFITGNIGDGKTMTSRKLLEDMRNSDTILLELNACNPSNFETLVNGTKNTVVFIDDFLGKEHMDGKLLKMWTRHFSLMEDMIETNNVQFILTTRKDILEEAKSSLKMYEFFRRERIVVMTTCDLSMVKEQILLRHVQMSSIFVMEDYLHNSFTTEVEKKKIITFNQIKEIAEIETPIGYPLCCYLFTRNKKYADEGKLFFLNPVHVLKWEIQRLEREDKHKYCALAVLLLCGGKISHYDTLSESRSNKYRKALTKVSKTCEIRLQRATIAKISIILASSGTFLRMTDDAGFIFSHNCVEKAISLAYRTKGLKNIIQMCPFRFLLEMVVTNSNDEPAIIKDPDRLDNVFTIELSIPEFDLLVDRFVCEILGGNAREVSHHKALLDTKFLHRFFAVIRESGKITQVITARENVNDVGGLLFYAADNEVPKVELLEGLLKLHSENQPRKNNCVRLNCFLATNGSNEYLEHAMSSALHAACRLGHIEICDILLKFDAKETPNLLLTAIQSQSFEIVQRLLQKYKWSEKQKQLALLESCKHGNIKLFDLIMQSVKCKLEKDMLSKCLLESVKSGNIDLLENILAEGCDVNYAGYFERCALHEACIGDHESLVVRLLHVPNININAIDRLGYTALHYAAENNLVRIVKLLINANAELKFSVRNDVTTVASGLPRRLKLRMMQMMSPYGLAKLRGHTDVCMVLEDVAFPGGK
ncbi:hypothetical protein ACJMK2_021698 [Sinanodonta woodiana]|uniref:Novel STAND NTPase 3 domain-containing protein n=1 Tax=Sinanodonta woodiana TaxID=1069815 RepID=A0ABD3TGU0_SINWO